VGQTFLSANVFLPDQKRIQRTQAMPPITGILETALYVKDMDRAVEFFERLFGFPIMNGDDRFCAFNVAPGNVLLLFLCGGTLTSVETGYGAIPPHDGLGTTHMAFSISAADLPAWEERLKQSGIAIESVVRWPKGSVSLYFRDPDDHLIELATPGLWANY
jgi:catechol 2,3-dioxygenase-like lactoylglutathione lyase family enzyme